MIEENCLLCFTAVTPTENQNCLTTIEDELFSYFTLDKLLQISKSTSTRLLESQGNLSTWFSVCRVCKEKIIEVRLLFQQLVKLQVQWENVKASIKNQVITCYQDEMSKQYDRKLSIPATLIRCDILKGLGSTSSALNCESQSKNQDLLDRVAVKVEQEELQTDFDPEKEDSFLHSFTRKSKIRNKDGFIGRESKKPTKCRKKRVKTAIKQKLIDSKVEDTPCRNTIIEKEESVPKSRSGRPIKKINRFHYESDSDNSDNVSEKSSQSYLQDESSSDSDCEDSSQDKAADEKDLCSPGTLNQGSRTSKRQRRKITDEYKCYLCENLQFKNGHLLEAHVKENHSGVEKPYICECKSSYPKLSTLQVHKRYQHNNRNIKSAVNCSMCKMIFKSDNSLQRHMHKVHRKQGYECSFCGKIFRTRYRRIQHESLIHRKERNVICEHCNASFQNKTSLQYHQMSKHNMVFENSSVSVKCEQCGKTLSCPASLKKHVDRVHKKNYNSFCPICNLGCYSKFLMKKHIMVAHTKNRSELCQYCGKGYTTKDKLADHIRTHTGEKPFQCEICGKAFHAKKHLVAHKKIHAGGSFQCEICSKTYATAEYMKHHIWYVHRKQQSSRLPNQKQIVDTEVLQTVAESAGLTLNELTPADELI